MRVQEVRRAHVGHKLRACQEQGVALVFIEIFDSIENDRPGLWTSAVDGDA